jgi:hypothetical protein
MLPWVFVISFVRISTSLVSRNRKKAEGSTPLETVAE